MKQIEYIAVQSLQELLAILHEKKGDLRLLAGGTDLVVRLKQNQVREETIVDISRIKELRGIYEESEWLHILPMTTHSEIVQDEAIKRFGFVLHEACKTVGSPQIRNRGTIGGNVCNASPAGDTITALFVHDAVLTARSLRGERKIKIEDFFSGPGKIVLEKDEVLTDIVIRKALDSEVGFFKKLGQRKGIAIAVVNVAVLLDMERSKKARKASVAFGAVAPTVARGRVVEKLLCESTLDSQETLLGICRLAYRDISPISDVRGSLEYRTDMASNLLYEGLVELFVRDFRRQ